MIDIDNLIKQALKSGNKTELKAYRNLKTEFQKVKTSKDYKGEWTDKLEVHTIAKYARQLDGAIAQFGGPQTTLGAEYSDELEVVKKVLPVPINESQIFQELCIYCVENKLAEKDETGITWKISKKEMGTVIKYLKSKFPTVDGKMISEIVKKYLI